MKSMHSKFLSETYVEPSEEDIMSTNDLKISKEDVLSTRELWQDTLEKFLLERGWSVSNDEWREWTHKDGVIGSGTLTDEEAFECEVDSK